MRFKKGRERLIDLGGVLFQGELFDPVHQQSSQRLICTEINREFSKIVLS